MRRLSFLESFFFFLQSTGDSSFNSSSHDCFNGTLEALIGLWQADLNLNAFFYQCDSRNVLVSMVFCLHDVKFHNIHWPTCGQNQTHLLESDALLESAQLWEPASLSNIDLCVVLPNGKHTPCTPVTLGLYETCFVNKSWRYLTYV